MKTLHINHRRTHGTTLEGAHFSDGSGQILKAHGWVYVLSISMWLIRHSRGHAANLAQIEATANALGEAGFAVEIEIDNTARQTAA